MWHTAYVSLRLSNNVDRPPTHQLLTLLCAALQQYVVVKDTSLIRKIENKEGLPWTVYLSVLGMPGMTAHHGWMEFVHPKKVLCSYVASAPLTF